MILMRISKSQMSYSIEQKLRIYLTILGEGFASRGKSAGDIHCHCAIWQQILENKSKSGQMLIREDYTIRIKSLKLNLWQ